MDQSKMAASNLPESKSWSLKRADWKIGRMAVLPDFRGREAGRALLNGLIAEAKRSGLQRVYLHSQLDALGFYKEAGFICKGPVFMEANIPHQEMVYRS